MSLVFKPLSRSHLMNTSVLLKVCFPREKNLIRIIYGGYISTTGSVPDSKFDN